MCYTERVYKKASIFFIHQYVQPCLSKNPKYTFYTIKSSLALAYYAISTTAIYLYKTSKLLQFFQNYGAILINCKQTGRSIKASSLLVSSEVTSRYSLLLLIHCSYIFFVC